MSDAAKPDHEESHHPYRRPRDAATLILIDRSHARPRVLVGRRHDNVVFMPGKYVFPGGSVDKTDNRIPVAAPIPQELEANLLKGSPKTEPSRARSLAIAAIREACEETGLCLGCRCDNGTHKLSGVWQPFADAGLLPDPSGLFLIARAITPPGRVRRFDTRFLAAWRDEAGLELPEGGPTGELEELMWLGLEEAKEVDIPLITKTVIEDLQTRLHKDPDLAPGGAVPFYRMRSGQFLRDLL